MGILRIGFLGFSLLSASALSASDLTAQCEQDEQRICPSKSLDRCPSWILGGDGALGLDYFRSLPDGSWPGNFGAFTSVNLALGIPKKTYEFGAQVGGSYGFYDWDGRGSNSSGNTKAMQQQGFVTLGLFRRTAECRGFSGGIVYDFMFNKQFGVFALSPMLQQLRAEMSYLFKGGNEIGAWATVNTNTSHRETSGIPVTFRAISQANIFWAHYFKNSAQIRFWAGTPYRRGLMHPSGRAGRYIVGANFQAPLSRTLSLFGRGVYMAPDSGSPVQTSSLFAANVCFGLNYSFGGYKGRERPYLSLADNSNFLVDTNFTQ